MSYFVTTTNSRTWPADRRLRRSMDGFQPRVDHSDTGVGEVLGVAGGEGGRLRPTDGGDLGVERVDGAADAVPVGDDVSVGAGRSEVEGEDLARKGGEDLADCLMQLGPAPSSGQACDAVAYLGYRDHRGVDVAPGMFLEPAQHGGQRGRTNKFGDDVAVENDHSGKAAARGDVVRVGRSSSTPPSRANRSMSAVKRSVRGSSSVTAAVRIARISASI